MKCNLCAIACNVDRVQNLGVCRIDDSIYVSHYGLHHGEEPFLTGETGSGAIFFAGCNLRCRFCQNYQISRWNLENKNNKKILKLSVSGLIEIIKKLESMGAVNINFVSPTPYADKIAIAIKKLKNEHFKLPFVYNTHGFDSLDTINMLNGLIDIYLPDLKYGNDLLGENFSGIRNLYSHGKKVIQAMYEQVGLLKLDKYNNARNGLIVRHLVLPGEIESTLNVLDYLESVDRDIHLSLMSQYHPGCGYEEKTYNNLNRTLTMEEYRRVVDYSETLGFSNLLTQEMESHQTYLPDFESSNVFNNQ